MVLPELLDRLEGLPIDKQQEVLHFVESLGGKIRPKRSIRGLCADLAISISEEDIAEMRRETLRHFPREDM